MAINTKTKLYRVHNSICLQADNQKVYLSKRQAIKLAWHSLIFCFTKRGTTKIAI